MDLSSNTIASKGMITLPQCAILLMSSSPVKNCCHVRLPSADPASIPLVVFLSITIKDKSPNKLSLAISLRNENRLSEGSQGNVGVSESNRDWSLEVGLWRGYGDQVAFAVLNFRSYCPSKCFRPIES